MLCAWPGLDRRELKRATRVNIFRVPCLLVQLYSADHRILYRLCLSVVLRYTSSYHEALIRAKRRSHRVKVFLLEFHKLVVLIIDEVCEFVPGVKHDKYKCED